MATPPRLTGTRSAFHFPSGCTMAWTPLTQTVKLVRSLKPVTVTAIWFEMAGGGSSLKPLWLRRIVKFVTEKFVAASKAIKDT